jgi:hypothetical protein
MALAQVVSGVILEWQGLIVHRPPVALDGVSVIIVTPLEVIDNVYLVNVMVHP